MRVSRVNTVVARVLAFLMSLGLLTDAGLAQGTDYSKPAKSFPNIFAPYEPRHVPEPNFANTGRIDQLIQNGSLMLSLNDAIALALENNLDLAIARYNLSIADTDILRTKAGSSAQGVPTGLVQGTPGGGVGSIGTAASGGGAGGTSAGAGGAGAGSSGLVTSTLGAGPTVDSFDPPHAPGFGGLQGAHEHLIEAHAVGAVFIHDVVRVDNISPALGHFVGARVHPNRRILF